METVKTESVWQTILGGSDSDKGSASAGSDSSMSGAGSMLGRDQHCFFVVRLPIVEMFWVVVCDMKNIQKNNCFNAFYFCHKLYKKVEKNK